MRKEAAHPTRKQGKKLRCPCGESLTDSTTIRRASNYDLVKLAAMVLLMWLLIVLIVPASIWIASLCCRSGNTLCGNVWCFRTAIRHGHKSPWRKVSDTKEVKFVGDVGHDYATCSKHKLSKEKGPLTGPLFVLACLVLFGIQLCAPWAAFKASEECYKAFSTELVPEHVLSGCAALLFVVAVLLLLPLGLWFLVDLARPILYIL